MYSSPFPPTGVTCPSGKCSRTYEICGTCVHDHFIGNIMYAYWTKLFGFKEATTYGGGHFFQLFGQSDDGTHSGAGQFDLGYDQAGYRLGFALFNSGITGFSCYGHSRS
ncbi:MAG: polymorphic toxin type 44 domain-containing protein [Phycisphaerales bacterium]